MGPLKDHNRHLAEHARLWLVATTDDPLVAAQSRFAAAKGVGQEDAKP
jgi:hypothetical protein